MKYLLWTALMLVPLSVTAAYEEEGLSEAIISTDTAKEEDDAQPMIMESDEDLADFVMDYLRRDIQLKGAFLMEDKASKKILKLNLISADTKAKSTGNGTRTVDAVFQDASSQKHLVTFYVQNGSWGGLDIFKIEVKKAPAPEKKKKP
ncbi:MAG TPA: hypothetical protein DCZ92_10700 [Elusimicrobia bacterium]|nr:MAG: hypothetical protein A2016_04390 [Elusimicrobia bacterium GWF2_62_30]HBA61263.1 hypothetical protein [Elusimicrobiota bacterium]